MGGRQRSGDGSPQAAWDERERVAGLRDHPRPGRRPPGTPPVLLPLVRAARRSTLSRFHPFHSHAMLRFATAPVHLPGERRILPVWIGVLPRGSYEVAALATGERRYEVLLETADPVAAVAGAERALSAF
ncbi:hypothetical protein ABZW10_38025 [Kitasatospora sp. NPDC004723]|uniref:hypothetical protein n=1 Tax=Kitasatospora sp. NPDC004723 TaxID=3154288 RepID=UPI0033B28FA9